MLVVLTLFLSVPYIFNYIFKSYAFKSYAFYSFLIKIYYRNLPV